MGEKRNACKMLLRKTEGKGFREIGRGGMR
jgi:hypothetical protein